MTYVNLISLLIEILSIF